MWEKFKTWFKGHKVLGGLLIAFPIVLLFYYFSVKNGGSNTGQLATMDYSPGDAGGTGGGSDATNSSDSIPLLTSFLERINQSAEEQNGTLKAFMDTQAENQQNFVTSLTGLLQTPTTVQPNVPTPVQQTTSGFIGPSIPNYVAPASDWEKVYTPSGGGGSSSGGGFVGPTLPAKTGSNKPTTSGTVATGKQTVAAKGGGTVSGYGEYKK